jgi:hypothetical protein
MSADHPEISASWVKQFAALLQTKVDQAEHHTITLNVASLAGLWVLELEETTDLICEAAHLAGLAVGIVNATTVDVISADAALLLLADAAGEEDDLAPPRGGDR